MAAHQNENGITRCLFGINGLAGYLIAVIGLVVTLAVLGYFSIVIQSENAETYYSVNQDLNGLKLNSIDNNSYRIMK
jgi:hypothetical protein